ncbi:MAG: DUF4091 domain-containing protein [Kiritimatiellae bacterium]|nr:DUF4091 domain-containing protein [Kiritimatiellia bacterium]
MFVSVIFGVAGFLAYGGTVLFDFETERDRSLVRRWSGSGISVSVEKSAFASGDYALRLACKPWRAGLGEWPSVTLPSPTSDWRGFDRLVVDVVSEYDAGTNAYLSVYIAGPEGKIINDVGLRGTVRISARGFHRLVVPLKNWPEKTSPSNITRIHFYTAAKSHPHGQVIHIDRIMLLKKGEPLPDVPESACRLLPLTMSGCDAQVAENDRLRNELAHAKDYARFCRQTATSPWRSDSMAIGMATSMEKIMPRGLFSARMIPKNGIRVRLARNEHESVQVLVSPLDYDLHNVRIALDGDLRGTSGIFPASNVICDVVGYVNITQSPPYRVGYNVLDAELQTGPGYMRKTRIPATGWWPDPLLGFMKDGVTVAGMDVQSFWIRVSCPERQPAGVYSGKLVISADRAKPIRIPFVVRVNAFTVPRVSPLPLAITFDPKGKFDLERSHIEAWCDFLADYYITMDNLYHNGDGVRFDVLERLGRQGRLGLFNLGYWSHPRSTNVADVAEWRAHVLPRIQTAYDEVKMRGLLGHAYLYGCDEVIRKHLPSVQTAVCLLKEACPGVPVATTAYDDSFGVATELRDIDWFVPLTPKYKIPEVKASRNEGRKVWWYICCVPSAPYANMFIECPAIEGRILMGAQSVKYRPDGFLYYQTTYWQSKRCIESGPFTDWEPRSWRDYHGDGSWVCVGPNGTPVPTIRLENFRDGLEDYAYAKILEEKLKRYSGKRSGTWHKKAKELISVPRKVVDSLKNYTDNPDVIYWWRDAMADMIAFP